MFGLGSELLFSSLLFLSFALWGSVNLWVGYFMMPLSIVESAAVGKRALKLWLESCAVCDGDNASSSISVISRAWRCHDQPLLFSW